LRNRRFHFLLIEIVIIALLGLRPLDDFALSIYKGDRTYLIDKYKVKSTLSCVKVTHFVYSQIPKNVSLLGIFRIFRKIFKNHQFEHSRTISKGCFHQRYWQTKISMKNKMPNTKYGLLLDNVPSHVSVKFPNLKLIFLPPNTTSRTQPLDLSVFGTLKNQYSSWLVRETLQNGPEGLNIEKYVRSMATIFKNLDVRSTNHGFSATKLNKFQS